MCWNCVLWVILWSEYIFSTWIYIKSSTIWVIILLISYSLEMHLWELFNVSNYSMILTWLSRILKYSSCLLMSWLLWYAVFCACRCVHACACMCTCVQVCVFVGAESSYHLISSFDIVEWRGGDLMITHIYVFLLYDIILMLGCCIGCICRSWFVESSYSQVIQRQLSSVIVWILLVWVFTGIVLHIWELSILYMEFLTPSYVLCAYLASFAGGIAPNSIIQNVSSGQVLCCVCHYFFDQ